jgi:hypothetical protein
MYAREEAGVVIFAVAEVSFTLSEWLQGALRFGTGCVRNTEDEKLCIYPINGESWKPAITRSIVILVAILCMVLGL